MPEPDVLRNNKSEWLIAFQNEPRNSTKKYRYRHPDIKSTLKTETSDKCVYCESKIGHNTPGDVEHKTPSSVSDALHFDWNNLTIACTECNRRKNDYFDAQKPFIDPYADDVEARLVHLGPIVNWIAGDDAAEISVRILALNDMGRPHLISRKVEKIDALNNVVARLKSAPSELMRDLMRVQIEKMKAADSEFSAMICAICALYGL